MARPIDPNSSSAAKRWQGYQPPELPNAEAYRRALARVRSMTPQQVFESSVRAGIHNSDGTLSDEYKSR